MTATCNGTLYNGPGKRFVRCSKCGTVDWESNEGDACREPREPARYVLSDDPKGAFTLAEFLAVNEDLDPEEVDAIRALEPGQSYTGGGGAAAEWTITRTTTGDQT